MKIFRFCCLFAFLLGLSSILGCEKDEPIPTEPIQQPVQDLLLDSVNAELSETYLGTCYYAEYQSINGMIKRDTVYGREMPNYNFRETEYEGSYQLFLDTTAAGPGIYSSKLISDTIRMSWWQGSLSRSYTFYRREKKFVTRFSSSHARSTRTSVYYAQ